MPTIEQLQKRAELVRTGGKGSVRRNKKAHHKSSGEDRKVTNVLRRLNVNPFDGIDEAVFYRADGTAMHFTKPKVQASMQNQCYVVSGDYAEQTAEEVAAAEPKTE
ncbi:nascent polypeptide-associated complex subunit beta [Angomonas deanei]|uniref:Nascent polypeptide-associated complex subunit beta n=1 Tax=Angomonas deanei TaxID=59799 RepID=S9X5G6_9TRYP|nr:nascent polypeptide-associated complex subunit beta [Angomonas deanei]EPY43760.1 nascent polypeptide-associated complex subunit beta [Angomonas deanei]CAD2212909.1 NAC domain containing protein, putative [Angomonas deanei]|eukprot:EPY43721.1 nascent polypeptide-associated complex subunit beta [Angomonas deanei]